MDVEGLKSDNNVQTTSLVFRELGEHLRNIPPALNRAVSHARRDPMSVEAVAIAQEIQRTLQENARDFEEHIFAIIGENNVGKSFILNLLGSLTCVTAYDYNSNKSFRSRDYKPGSEALDYIHRGSSIPVKLLDENTVSDHESFQKQLDEAMMHGLDQQLPNVLEQGPLDDSITGKESFSFLLPSSNKGIATTSHLLYLRYATTFQLVVEYEDESWAIGAVRQWTSQQYRDNTRASCEKRYEALTGTFATDDDSQFGKNIVFRRAVREAFGRIDVFATAGRDLTTDRILIKQQLALLQPAAELCNGDGNSLRYLIKRITVFAPLNVLASGQVLVDVPGTNHTDPLNHSLQLDILASCHSVLLLHSRAFNCSETTRDVLMASRFPSRLLQNPDRHHLIVLHYPEKSENSTLDRLEDESAMTERRKIDSTVDQQNQAEVRQLLEKTAALNVIAADINKIMTNSVVFMSIRPLLALALVHDQGSPRDEKYDFVKYIKHTNVPRLLGSLECSASVSILALVKPIYERLQKLASAGATFGTTSTPTSTAISSSQQHFVLSQSPLQPVQSPARFILMQEEWEQVASITEFAAKARIPNKIIPTLQEVANRAGLTIKDNLFLNLRRQLEEYAAAVVQRNGAFDGEIRDYEAYLDTNTEKIVNSITVNTIPSLQSVDRGMHDNLNLVNLIFPPSHLHLSNNFVENFLISETDKIFRQAEKLLVEGLVSSFPKIDSSAFAYNLMASKIGDRIFSEIVKHRSELKAKRWRQIAVQNLQTELDALQRKLVVEILKKLERDARLGPPPVAPSTSQNKRRKTDTDVDSRVHDWIYVARTLLRSALNELRMTLRQRLQVFFEAVMSQAIDCLILFMQPNGNSPAGKYRRVFISACRNLHAVALSHLSDQPQQLTASLSPIVNVSLSALQEWISKYEMLEPEQIGMDFIERITRDTKLSKLGMDKVSREFDVLNRRYLDRLQIIQQQPLDVSCAAESVKDIVSHLQAANELFFFNDCLAEMKERLRVHHLQLQNEDNNEIFSILALLFTGTQTAEAINVVKMRIFVEIFCSSVDVQLAPDQTIFDWIQINRNNHHPQQTDLALFLRYAAIVAQEPISLWLPNNHIFIRSRNSLRTDHLSTSLPKYQLALISEMRIALVVPDGTTSTVGAHTSYTALSTATPAPAVSPTMSSASATAPSPTPSPVPVVATATATVASFDFPFDTSNNNNSVITRSFDNDDDDDNNEDNLSVVEMDIMPERPSVLRARLADSLSEFAVIIVPDIHVLMDAECRAALATELARQNSTRVSLLIPEAVRQNLQVRTRKRILPGEDKEASLLRQRSAKDVLKLFTKFQRARVVNEQFQHHEFNRKIFAQQLNLQPFDDLVVACAVNAIVDLAPRRVLLLTNNKNLIRAAGDKVNTHFWTKGDKLATVIR